MQIEVVRHYHGADHCDRRRELSPGEFGDEDAPGDLGRVGSGDRGEGREGGALFFFKEREEGGTKTRES